MRRLHFCFFFTLCLFQSSFCLSQDIVHLRTQADVDAFDQSITDISGQLSIGSFPGDPDPITDLARLSNLTSIDEDLRIRYNSALTNIDGLANLTSVGGTLWIDFNGVLTNIDGLSNLTYIGENLFIESNDALLNLDALSSVTTIDGTLKIGFNDLLTNIDGLTNLTFEDGNLVIKANDALLNIDALLNLAATVNFLLIEGNDSLTNIDALSSVTSISGNLWIASNDALTNIDGLANIKTIGLDLRVNNNDTLRNCCGIQHLLTMPGRVEGIVSISNNSSGCDNPDEVIEASCIISATDNPNNMDGHLFNLYPNPTNGQIVINLNQNYNNIQVKIINSVGQIINSKNYNNTDQVTTNFDNFPGFYFIHVQTDTDQQEIFRVIRK